MRKKQGLVNVLNTKGLGIFNRYGSDVQNLHYLGHFTYIYSCSYPTKHHSYLSNIIFPLSNQDIYPVFNRIVAFSQSNPSPHLASRAAWAQRPHSKATSQQGAKKE